MAKPRKSVTPKADAQAQLFAALYAKHEKIDCTCAQFERRACKCGCKMRWGMSAYAFHRSGAECFILTECGRSIWFNRIDYDTLKEAPAHPV